MRKRAMKKRREKKGLNWKVLVLCLALTYIVGFVGSLFTSQGANSEWYESIKPSITPPNYIFTIIWDILFFLVALSLYFAWTGAKDDKKKEQITLAFGMNFLLNILWSAIFFGMKNPLIALGEIKLLSLSIIWMGLVCWRANKLATFLLIPYLAWVYFAGVINFIIVFG